LPAYLDAAKGLSGGGIDDRKFLLEKMLVLMSRLPKDSTFAAQLQQVVIEILYKDLPHPPSSYLALPSPEQLSISPSLKGAKYAYRSADGSNYNVLFPAMGKARTPYARSVPSAGNNIPSNLPDAGLVFDTLLKRDKFVPHPGGISSCFFAFANLVIHSIFNTDHRDWTINNSSSYLDLSILYGSSDREVDAVRRKDGTGRLWEDVLADSRLLFMPPSTCALLVIFSRNHNYIADKILSINENGSLSNPPPEDPVACRAQDDEIFHRSRLVNSAYFVQVILRDYVGAILGLIRDGSSWRLDPLKASRDLNHDPFPQGEGNTVSMEFNLLYRWHTTTSVYDEQWIGDEIKKLIPGKDFNQITVQDFERGAVQMIPDRDVRKWTFGGLTRDSNGRFKDSDLASIIQNATEAPACAFKARGIPDALRVVELLGIEQARSWGASSLNEFRKFMGLKPYTTFAEWNSDPEIHTAAAALYHHIDNLELYVGMRSEEAKVPMPGAGLCPGYTISRAILSDAVCLTRGDRFLTVDYTPFNLTTWGYNDCQANEKDGAYGGLMSKMLLRHLPDYYSANSAYALFPFMVPETMKGSLAKQHGAPPVDAYDWTKPSGIKLLKVPSVDTRIAKILKQPIVDVRGVLYSAEAIEIWSTSFQQITERLISEKSVSHQGYSGMYLDVVRDVINFAPVHWISTNIMGLPLKSVEDPSGAYREQDMFDMFATVANYLYINADLCNDWYLREESSNTVDIVTNSVSSRILQLPLNPIALLRRLSTSSYFTATSKEFLRRLTTTIDVAPNALAGGLIRETVATAAIFSKSVAHVLDYFLRDDMASARQAFAVKSSEVDTKIMQQIRQALQSTSHGKQPVTDGMMTHEFFEKATLEILRAIFTLPGLKRAPGRAGQLRSFIHEISRGVIQEAYLDQNGNMTPWPVSLVVQYDHHIHNSFH